VLKETALWANAGYEIAFGQFVYQVGTREIAQLSGDLRVAHGDVNIGVHGRDFTVMFSKGAGSLASLNYGSEEMIS